MKKCVLTGVLAAGVAMAGSALAGDKPSIGVAEFLNETTTATWWRGQSVGWELSDMLTNELASTNSFLIVERAKLEPVLAEQNLAASGRVEKSTGAQIGKLTGAQYLVMGKVSAYEENTSSTGGGIAYKGIALGGKKSEAYMAIDLRVVDTTTGVVAFSRTVEGRSSGGGISVGYAKNGIGGSLAHEEKTPAGKAIRAALVEASEYLECYMVKQDGCQAAFEQKEQKRRESSKDALKLD